MFFSILALITFYSSFIIRVLTINLQFITTAFAIVGSTLLVILFVPYQVYKNYIAQRPIPSSQKPDAYESEVYIQRKKEIIASADSIRDRKPTSSEIENQDQLLITVPQSIKKHETGSNSINDTQDHFNTLTTTARHSQYAHTQIINGPEYPQMRVWFKSGEYKFLWIPKWSELYQILDSTIEIENARANWYQSEWDKIFSDINRVLANKQMLAQHDRSQLNKVRVNKAETNHTCEFCGFDHDSNLKRCPFCGW